MLRIGISLVFAISAPVSSLAQSPLESFESGVSFDLFGKHVRAVGDLNGDGIEDIGVGAYGLAPGRFYAYSGADGSLLYSIGGGHADSNSFAFSFDSLRHDLDGDGVHDLAIGAMKYNALRGRVAIVSGADGSLISEVVGDGPDGWFGYSVSHLGDVDGDGVPEFVAGAIWADEAGPNFGRVRVVNPSTGATWLAVDGNATASRFGMHVDGLGDVNGDGTPDFVVSAPAEANGTANGAGRVRVLSGSDGSLVHMFSGGQSSQNLGDPVRAAGDVDGDGVTDVIAGARWFNAPGAGNDEGLVRVWSGATGVRLHQYFGTEADGLLGWGVGPVGDVDGDGKDDFAFAGIVPNVESYVVVASGATGDPLRRITGPNSFGGDIARLTDLTGDGFDEFIVGAQQAVPYEYGEAYVFQGHPGDVLGNDYCAPAVVNSKGRSGELFAAGNSRASADETWVLCQHLPAASTALLLASEISAFTPAPGGSQGNLCLGGTVLRLGAATTTARGTHTWRVPTGALPGYGPILAGDTWRFQAWYRDANPSSTSNFTSACAVLYQ